MRIRPAVLVGLLLAAASMPVAAIYVPRAEVETAARTAAVQAKQLGGEAAETAALQQAQWRVLGEPLVNEARMQAALLQLRDVTAPTLATRAAVSALLDYSPQTLTDPVDAEQRGRQVPAFAIASTARAALTYWQQQSDVAALRKALATADTPGIGTIANPRALSEVIATATPAELELLRSGIEATPANLRALFERLADRQLALDALRQPADGESLGLIADVVRLLPAIDAFAVLTDPGLATDCISAARLALAALVAPLPLAREYLLARLGDGAGDSAGVALGRSGDAQSLQALVAIAGAGIDTPQLRHALLGLRASSDPAAAAALAAFAADARRPAALRGEVARWLR